MEEQAAKERDIDEEMVPSGDVTVRMNEGTYIK